MPALPLSPQSVSAPGVELHQFPERENLYILDDGSDVAVVLLQGESPDLWIVEVVKAGRLPSDGPDLPVKGRRKSPARRRG